MPSIKQLQIDIHETSSKHGWWQPQTPVPSWAQRWLSKLFGITLPEHNPHGRTFGDVLVLVHSELSEALEEYRDGKDIDCVEFVSSGRSTGVWEADWKPVGVPIELADAVIRILDACEEYDIDLEDAIMVKMAYNKQREFRHGNKRL